MGKVLIIAVVVISVIFATISFTLNRQTAKIPEIITQNMAELRAKSLSNNALIYSIRQLKEGHISFSHESCLQSFSGFNVLDGTIDSIKYVINSSGDTIIVTSYVTSNISGTRANYRSWTKLLFLSYFDNAITSSGGINILGNAQIIGNVKEYATLDFESVFGMSMAAMDSIADNHYLNPANNISPVNGITYIETTGNNTCQFTNHHWSGEGILIVNGNFQMTGGHFEGIIWVTGEFKMAGNGLIEGTIFIDGDPADESKFTGTCDVNYDEDIINKLLGIYNIPSDPSIKILSWDNN